MQSLGLSKWSEKLLPSGVGRTGRRLRPSLRYLLTPEVHVYASSIAANALLSFFPFTLILLTVCHQWLHWEGAYQVILQLLRANLPSGGDFVVRNLMAMVGARRRVQVISVITLFFTSSGIFLPLEIALNKVWGFTQSRSFLRNQGTSFVLAVVSGVLTLLSILLTAEAEKLVQGLRRIPLHLLASVVSRLVLEAISVPTVIVIYFVIFYFLPNGKVPARYVLPGATLAGVLTELGKFVYLVSLPLFGFREVYGPFTLSVTLFFWAFAGALILLWGAHISHRGFERSSERSQREQLAHVQPATAQVRSKVHEHQAGNPEHS
jgi:membrane protein